MDGPASRIAKRLSALRGCWTGDSLGYRVDSNGMKQKGSVKELSDGPKDLRKRWTNGDEKKYDKSNFREVFAKLFTGELGITF